MFDRPLPEVSWLAVAIETTGADRRRDCIVELTAVAVAPGQAPRVVLDTLVDPRRPLTTAQSLGITPDLLVGAPVFSDLVPTLRAALAKRVLVAHNGAFTLGFLRAALWRAGWDDPIPWLCTMRLPRALGGSGRWPLWFASAHAGFQLADAHSTRNSAFATAELIRHQTNIATISGVSNLAGLTERARSVGMEDAWLDALEAPPWPSPPLVLGGGHARLRPRRQRMTAREQTSSERYLTAVVQFITNLRLPAGALAQLAELPRRLRLVA